MKAFWAVSLISISLSQTTRAEGDCRPPPKPSIAASVRQWRDLKTSNPRNHSDSSFVYSIAAINLENPPLEKADVQVFLKKRVQYSSIINQDNRASFGTSGLILDLEPHQISHAVPYDTATTPCSDFNCENASRDDIQAKLKKLRAEHGIHSPSELLKPRRTWNEILLTTLARNDKIKVKGIFLMVDSHNQPLERNGIEEIRAYAAAKTFGVPVVRIRRHDHGEGSQFPPSETQQDCPHHLVKPKAPTARP